MFKLTKEHFSAADFARRIMLAWLLAAAAEYLNLPRKLRDLTALCGLAEMSFARVIGITCGITVLLTGLSCFFRTERAERCGIAISFAVLAAAALGAMTAPTEAPISAAQMLSTPVSAARVLSAPVSAAQALPATTSLAQALSPFTSASPAFPAACALILAVLVIFTVRGWEKTPEPAAKPKKAPAVCLWLTVGMSAAFFLFVSAWTVGRVYSFCSPTYDFGIFSQMFFNMKKSGLPMTTLERDGLLSHFAVHLSPIYYLMLPFYRLAPTPAALQVLQAAVITSAVIPLWKIGKYHGLTGAQRVLVCALLFLYPAYSGGTGYDLHENCFLTPLILWTLYGIERKNTAVTAAAAILTLMVKEDASVYIAVIGLWLISRTLLRFKKDDTRTLITGILLFTVSLIWFLLAVRYLARRGDGVMTWRYQNFMYDGSDSLVTLIKSAILCPMKAVYECVDPEKLPYIAMTLLTLLGLPLLTRRYERYILLIPFLLVNLMPDYQYQHDIFFQYSFGSGAFLLYLTVLNLSDLKIPPRRTLILTAAAAVSAVCFCSTVVPKAVHYPIQAIQKHSYYQAIRDILDTIPENAPTATSTFYTVHLSQRDMLYDIAYCSEEHLLSAEYVVLSLSSDGDYKKYASDGKNNGRANLLKLLTDHGYTEYGRLDGVLVILSASPAANQNVSSE